MLNAKIIEKVIASIPFVQELLFIEEKDFFIRGEVKISYEKLKDPLKFKFRISPQYPLKSYKSETIKFINESLMMYNHVMGDGSICIHTSNNPDLTQKLLIDFHSLKDWIDTYYLNHHKDKNYEHIILTPNLVNDKYYSFLFTDVDYKFKKGDCGEIDLSMMSEGIYQGKPIISYMVQGFSTASDNKIECKWSKYFKEQSVSNTGFYIFIETPPAIYGKFAYDQILDLKELLPQNFLKTLLDFEDENTHSQKGNIIPVFIGYKTVRTEIHWQAILLKIGEFPIEKDYEEVSNLLIPVGKLKESKINWAITHDASYNYYFGRGALCFQITQSKILIIGIGALGSMIAKTLVKGGAQFIDIADYDVKEPGNVCRSEYLFQSGLTDKVWELKQVLTASSPFVDIRIFKKEYFEDVIKYVSKVSKEKDRLSNILNEYDLIFDCTTDNDLMFVFDHLNLECSLINLSITNFAKELVCAYSPNVYHFVTTQYETLLENNIENMYEPTGCWHPTFKASYNDIALLVQFAIKKINYTLANKKSKKQFHYKNNQYKFEHNRILKFKIIEKNVEIILSDALLGELGEYGKAHYPNEFGGFLIGFYSKDFSRLFLSGSILPQKFNGVPHYFERSIEGIENRLTQLFYEKGLYYVGEWHTHPNGSTQYSQQDLQTMMQIQDCETVQINNPILLIISVDQNQIRNFTFYLYENGELIEYEQH